ncbi:type 4a pilus biogenesis protein PilO [Brevibacillus sp. SYP-B805]|uniref:type 4a pilus biogenesis protein PilO n=1 Tax=Brevibacillus sp. SYP-B805 TaxID=1578199 RepID=UPI0013E9EDFF|nr:type 4a pilus biogenesis protein PilO [Brevibacillus sp. SYP-B805]NGQ94315.1 type 4a pilus biogenesis protein PilO [Brevibacillus sp. SYP-B805]
MTITRQTILLILMLCFLASGGFYYVFIHPLAGEQEKLQEDLKRERQFVTALQKASQEKKTNGEIRFPPDFQYRIPEAPYLEQLMLDMTRVETISGVEMDGIGLSDGGRQEEGGAQQQQEQEIQFTPIGGAPQGQNGAIPGLKRVSITTKIKGNYEQIHRFFAEVLSLPRLIRVEQVKLSAGGKDDFIFLNPQEDKRKELSAEVTLSAYYAPKLKQYFPQPLPIITPQPAHRSNPFY